MSATVWEMWARIIRNEGTYLVSEAAGKCNGSPRGLQTGKISREKGMHEEIWSQYGLRDASIRSAHGFPGCPTCARRRVKAKNATSTWPSSAARTFVGVVLTYFMSLFDFRASLRRSEGFSRKQLLAMATSASVPCLCDCLEGAVQALGVVRSEFDEGN